MLTNSWLPVQLTEMVEDQTKLHIIPCQSPVDAVSSSQCWTRQSHWTSGLPDVSISGSQVDDDISTGL